MKFQETSRVKNEILVEPPSWNGFQMTNSRVDAIDKKVSYLENGVDKKAWSIMYSIAFSINEILLQQR